jgi:transcription-repair coupling factor (superfamily II helicase)
LDRLIDLKKIISIYRQDKSILNFVELLQQDRTQHLALKGTIGSQLSFVITALQSYISRTGFFIAKDREQAQSIASDLMELMLDTEVFLFPSSNKRPYQIETVDNANVLMRTEVLNAINQSSSGNLFIVTYPEALNEKVITRKSLVKHTFNLTVNEQPGMDIVKEVLLSYGYDSVVFVSKPGEFAIRGGIIDVFSFSYEKPYRIEFDGESIESIRVFDVDDQMSIRGINSITVLPNLQSNDILEERVSIFEFLSPSTLIYSHDLTEVKQVIEESFSKAIEQYEQFHQSSSGSTIRNKPENLYYDAKQLAAELQSFSVIELFPSDFFKTYDHSIYYDSNHQPYFKKQFDLLMNHLLADQEKGIKHYISCENQRQLRRLAEIFEQVNPAVEFNGFISALHGGFIDRNHQFALYTDHQIFERYHQYKKRPVAQANTSLKEILQLQPGDYITHINHGIGRFAGLEVIKVGPNEQEAVKLLFEGDDTIFVPINSLYKISRYSSKDGASPKLSKIGSQEWSKTKTKVKKRIKELAFDLVSLYAKRRAEHGLAFSPDNYMIHELEASFMYEETPDQAKAIEDVKADMEKSYPMDRLVCGDVGFGKTEVAVRAAFKAAVDGKQVAVLVPTTILAMQHFNTFVERLSNLPVNIDYINRFKSAKEQKETLKLLAEGKIDIIIGTHRLLSKDVQFKDLGLFIIDEEHKFGVADKEKLKLIRINVDTLTLTATPIPRTLQFSLLGIRDMSVINTPPANRQPVETLVKSFSQELIRDAIAYEMRRGGQVFFIHNRIKDLEEIGALIKKLVPEAQIGIAHGQQPGDQMEEVLLRFIDKQFDVLLCTTIIESGIDITNANTIIINAAHSFGLSDLHQMRGRVGRSNKKAYCYLLVPSLLTLTTESRKRLNAIEEFSDIGSGIQIALRDLDIRGAGDILGKEQSGFISEIGYELYQRILEESIIELKAEQGFGPQQEEGKIVLGISESQFDSDLEILIPEKYISNVAERLNFYKRLSETVDESQLQAIAREMQDRFGMLPAPVIDLFDTIRIRECAKQLGFERVLLKEAKMKCTFIADTKSTYFQSPTFQMVIQYINQHPESVTLKQAKQGLQLLFEDVPTIKNAYFLLKNIVNKVQVAEPSQV